MCHRATGKEQYFRRKSWHSLVPTSPPHSQSLAHLPTDWLTYSFICVFAHSSTASAIDLLNSLLTDAHTHYWQTHTHAHTHWHIHIDTHPLTDTSTNTHRRPLVHVPTHSVIDWLIRSRPDPYTHSLTHIESVDSLIVWLVEKLSHLTIRSLIHTPIYSLTYSCTRALKHHSLTHPPTDQLSPTLKQR